VEESVPNRDAVERVVHRAVESGDQLADKIGAVAGANGEGVTDFVFEPGTFQRKRQVTRVLGGTGSVKFAVRDQRGGEGVAATVLGKLRVEN